jgi:carboxylesterase type B
MAGSAAGFDGDDLIREAGGGIVAVIIQYRLGVFGFLAGQKVHDGGALNAGLRECYCLRSLRDTLTALHLLVDQQFALQWVQQHVRAH